MKYGLLWKNLVIKLQKSFTENEIFIEIFKESFCTRQSLSGVFLLSKTTSHVLGNLSDVKFFKILFNEVVKK